MLTAADTAPLFEPLPLRRGAPMPNHFMLAPLTNQQSHDDGTVSAEEHRWLTMRAEGGFGATMTAAAHVQEVGQGFKGQLGIFDDSLIPGLAKLADGINVTGSMSLAQLHHAGNRSPRDLIGTDPVYPSPDEATGARGLSFAEVEQLVDDFANAAVRAEAAGFHGVELHGAHGYIICAFLSAQSNRRDDAYGGSPENRARLLFDIIREVRSRCGEDFVLGVRLSPERFGLSLDDIVGVAGSLLVDDRVDFLDMSLWDCFKLPEEEAHRDQLLIEHFTKLERSIPLGVAGKITKPVHALRVLELGADFPIIGRAAIIHHDYPNLLKADPTWIPMSLPVTTRHLLDEGLSEPFVHYVGTTWKGFVSDIS